MFSIYADALTLNNASIVSDVNYEVLNVLYQSRAICDSLDWIWRRANKICSSRWSIDNNFARRRSWDCKYYANNDE